MKNTIKKTSGRKVMSVNVNKELIGKIKLLAAVTDDKSFSDFVEEGLQLILDKAESKKSLHEALEALKKFEQE